MAEAEIRKAESLFLPAVGILKAFCVLHVKSGGHSCRASPYNDGDLNGNPPLPTEIPVNFAGCLMEVREPRPHLDAEAEEAAEIAACPTASSQILGNEKSRWAAAKWVARSQSQRPLRDLGLSPASCGFVPRAGEGERLQNSQTWRRKGNESKIRDVEPPFFLQGPGYRPALLRFLRPGGAPAAQTRPRGPAPSLLAPKPGTCGLLPWDSGAGRGLGQAVPGIGNASGCTDRTGLGGSYLTLSSRCGSKTKTQRNRY